SVSIAVMISLSCGIVFGPKIFRGGLFNVTRQYAAECLVSKTRFSVFIKPPAVRTSPSLAVSRREADEVTHVELPNTLGAKRNRSKLRRESKVITSLRTSQGISSTTSLCSSRISFVTWKGFSNTQFKTGP